MVEVPYSKSKTLNKKCGPCSYDHPKTLPADQLVRTGNVFHSQSGVGHQELERKFYSKLKNKI